MFYSLRFGILMAMLAVAAVAITTVTIFVGLTTRTQFARYVEAGQNLRTERLEQAVVMWSNEEQLQNMPSLDSVQLIAENSQFTDGNFRIRPLGTFGVLEPISNIDVPEGELVRFEISPDGDVQVLRGQEVVGEVFVDPVSELELQSAQREFFETVNWTLVITAIVAGVAAITLTVILSRRILHPVAALTLAARRMESGDLMQRVKVYANGEIGELAHAFNAMAEALNRNEQLRRNMVTDIAHELRTPLTNIRGYLEALQDGVIEPDTETIDSLHDEAVMLNQLIQDLQELALAEAGAIQFERQEVALTSVVEQTLTASQANAAVKKISLNADMPDDLPYVLADQRRVAQVMHNLISNAITHTPPDGRVHVTADVYATEIEIRVSDTGDGIDSEHLPYLFERFYRADRSRSRATGGAGLGLAIVKNLIESQGGRVQVDSVKGKGATFSFTLPRVTPQFT